MSKTLENVFKQFVIRCQRCHHSEMREIPKIVMFQKQMRQEGWRNRRTKTCCPRCVSELSEGRKWEDVGPRGVL